MNSSSFKTLRVDRKLTYRYYFQPPAENNRVLLFIHGFPSTSLDWQRQIAYLEPKGYGILAPDMLGFGGTAKPLDDKEFRLNLIAADIINILDHEKLTTVIGIAHDWGCVILSRLAVLSPERFDGFVWLGLSFMDPITQHFDLKSIMGAMKELLGYEGYAYWEFFSRDDAPAVIEQNLESFMQLLYPKDPHCWRTYMALPGKTEEWVGGNRQPGRPDYLTNEEFDSICQEFLKTGIRSPLNYYISQIHNNDLEDNQKIPEERWKLQRPSFFAPALKDCICTPLRGRAMMEQYGVDVTIVEFDAGHWVHLEHSDGVNRELEKWLLMLK